MHVFGTPKEETTAQKIEEVREDIRDFVNENLQALEHKAIMWITIASVIGAIVLIYLLSRLLAPKRFNVRDKVVVVTGGSSGIGLSIAKVILEKGGRVALLGRTQEMLDDAMERLKGDGHSHERFFNVVCDVTDNGDMDNAIQAVLKRFARIDALINSAGVSCPLDFEHTSPDIFDNVLRTNVLGTRNAVASCLPFLKRVDVGRIVLLSATAGQAGVFGYTAYSASKFALTGFAQALQMELVPYNIRVCVAYPPETETPMLADENKHKPPEAKEICGDNPMAPETVARCVVSGMESGKFAIPVGFEGWMAKTLTAGMNPESLWDTLVESAFMGPLRVLSLFYTMSCNAIVRKHHAKRGIKEKAH